MGFNALKLPPHDPRGSRTERRESERFQACPDHKHLPADFRAFRREVPILNPVVAELFRASSYSLNSETADFRLRRTIPITIFVDGDYEDIGAVAADLQDRAIEILASSGYKLVGQWGPHEGSYLITLFGQGKDPETWVLASSEDVPRTQ